MEWKVLIILLILKKNFIVTTETIGDYLKFNKIVQVIAEIAKIDIKEIAIENNTFYSDSTFPIEEILHGFNLLKKTIKKENLNLYIIKKIDKTTEENKIKKSDIYFLSKINNEFKFIRLPLIFYLYPIKKELNRKNIKHFRFPASLKLNTEKALEEIFINNELDFADEHENLDNIKSNTSFNEKELVLDKFNIYSTENLNKNDKEKILNFLNNYENLNQEFKEMNIETAENVLKENEEKNQLLLLQNYSNFKKSKTKALKK